MNEGTLLDSAKKVFSNLSVRKSLRQLQQEDFNLISGSVKTESTLNDEELVKSIVRSMRKRLNVHIIFNRRYPERNAGEAYVSLVRKKDLPFLNKTNDFTGKTLSLYDPSLTHAPDNTPVIVVEPLEIIASYSRDRDLTTDELVEIILHEYGHVLTYKELTMADFYERKIYITFSDVFYSTVRRVAPFAIDEARGATMYIYHNLIRVERIANERAHVNVDKLITCFYGKPASGKFMGHDIQLIKDPVKKLVQLGLEKSPHYKSELYKFCKDMILKLLPSEYHKRIEDLFTKYPK